MVDVSCLLLFMFTFMQLMCLADLEFDYINPYDAASRVNKLVFPEFFTQGGLCVFYLLTGHWAMALLGIPYTYYNYRLYVYSFFKLIFCLVVMI